MKKNLALAVIFILIFGLNLLLLSVYRSRNRSQAEFKRIFDEIAAASTIDHKFTFSAPPLVPGVQNPAITLVDPRVANLKSFFRRHDSPLYDLAEKIIEVSDKYNLDYRLLPSIAMQESGLCRSIPENSFNCWGWGINSSQTIRFASFEEGIETVARGIKIGYVDKGLITPEDIMAKYAPSSTTWAGGINHFLGVLGR